MSFDPLTLIYFIYQVAGEPFIWVAAFVGGGFFAVRALDLLVSFLENRL